MCVACVFNVTSHTIMPNEPHEMLRCRICEISFIYSYNNVYWVDEYNLRRATANSGNFVHLKHMECKIHISRFLHSSLFRNRIELSRQIYPHLTSDKKRIAKTYIDLKRPSALLDFFSDINNLYVTTMLRILARKICSHQVKNVPVC